MMSYYPEPDSVVGRSAYVTVAIPGGSQGGRNILRVSGGTESYIALPTSRSKWARRSSWWPTGERATLFVAPL